MAQFNAPLGVAQMPNDPTEAVYVADTDNHCIRKISKNVHGQLGVQTIAGDGEGGFEDGVLTHARFFSPSDLCVDVRGNIFVADRYNHRVRKISKEGRWVLTPRAPLAACDKPRGRAVHACRRGAAPPDVLHVLHPARSARPDPSRAGYDTAEGCEVGSLGCLVARRATKPATAFEGDVEHLLAIVDAIAAYLAFGIVRMNAQRLERGASGA